MIYLDNAATTFPKPTCVAEEMTKCLKKYCGNPGRSSHKLSVASSEKIYEARVLLAEAFDADAENVVFTYNTTYALNMAIKSNLRYSSHVLISDIEHNSVIRPIAECVRQKLCTYSVFESGGSDDEIIKSIKKNMRNDTSMLVCTHVSNVGSRTLPIKKIGALCKERGIFFIVDGAQSAGIKSISVKDMNIDALCIPGHKGLYGPQGVGAIIYGSDKIGRTLIEGGTGINSLETTMPDFLPERYEAGTLATPCIAALAESIKWLKTVNTDKIRSHEENLYTTLCDLLSEKDEITVYKMNDYPGNTLMFNVKNLSSATVASELDKRDICVRSGFHCSPSAHKLLKTGDGGAVRVGISVFNKPADIYSLYEALCDIIKNKRPR